MPLHLLGKKSWNVYNQENIARVRRNEAEAKAHEEREEQRMQGEDAVRRIELLRGTLPSSITSKSEVKDVNGDFRSESRPQGKRRRIAGEDETDREIRYALEDAATNEASLLPLMRQVADGPLTDGEGHINLISTKAIHHGEGNAEAEVEKARKQREHEDQYTMRFSNAAGLKKGLGNPWYSSTVRDSLSSGSISSRDVWGNEDPGRHSREKRRIDASDPLAAMKRGVTQLRVAEKHRKEWLREREPDLMWLEDSAAKMTKKERKRGEDEGTSIEDFKMDHNVGELDHRRRRDRSGQQSERERKKHRHKHSDWQSDYQKNEIGRDHSKRRTRYS